MLSLGRTALFMVAALGCVSANSIGPAFNTGPAASDTFIKEAISTLILPDSPKGSSGDLLISAGMDTTNGEDLIRFLATNTNGAWDVLAYTLIQTPAKSRAPIPERSTPASPGDHVTMHYLYDDASQRYTQYVLLNGKQVSNMTASDGDAETWGSFVTCQDQGNCGTVSSHKWINTNITLSKADSSYGSSLTKSKGIVGDLTTNDGGLSWSSSLFTIPEFTFN